MIFETIQVLKKRKKYPLDNALVLIWKNLTSIMSSTDKQYAKIVQEDFDLLSRSYDLINNFMSLGTDRQFRYLAIKNVIPEDTKRSKLLRWIDIGAGTGHLANELHRQKPGCFVIGIDISLSMLKFAKNREIYEIGLMNLIISDAAKTPFRKASFDGGFSGFVGRHFVNYPMTLAEHYRIIRPRGRLMMLEMGRRATRLSFLIDIYVGRLMSILGKLAVIINTKGKAPFRLLEETYSRFHSPVELKNFFEKAGFLTNYKLGLVGSIVIVLGYRKL